MESQQHGWSGTTAGALSDRMTLTKGKGKVSRPVVRPLMFYGNEYCSSKVWHCPKISAAKKQMLGEICTHIRTNKTRKWPHSMHNLNKTVLYTKKWLHSTESDIVRLVMFYDKW